ncbi:MAG: hypothetical protein R3A51_06445 [Nannocystaceae bacterium]
MVTSSTPACCAAIGGDADLLAGHVVDVEADDADRLPWLQWTPASKTSARRMLVMPSRRRVPVPVPVARRRPLPVPPARRRGAPEDRRACRRHALAADAVVAPVEAGEDGGGRGRRDRQQAVRCLHQPGRAAGEETVQRASSAAAMLPAQTVSTSEPPASSWKWTSPTATAWMAAWPCQRGW